MGVRITIEVDGKEFPLTVEGIDAAERAAHVASGLPEPSTAVVQATEDLDRAQLLVALEEAHRTHHAAVEANKQLAARLRERTIERDHFREDGLLFGLVAAWLIDTHGSDGELDIPRRDIDRFLGRMVEGNVDSSGEVLTLTLADRPERSNEAPDG